MDGYSNVCDGSPSLIISNWGAALDGCPSYGTCWRATCIHMEIRALNGQGKPHGALGVTNQHGVGEGEQLQKNSKQMSGIAENVYLTRF